MNLQNFGDYFCIIRDRKQLLFIINKSFDLPLVIGLANLPLQIFQEISKIPSKPTLCIIHLKTRTL
ncbi:hypothetical protein HSHS1_02430 [Helicobacter suis HS1]|uniref:Uncharacterized protein n=1 Tax=Helicobacter suis TaxID=104628 RepID=A0A6J4CVR4_9HELI|nr:hypothetical protein SNTW_02220 [Helicobacter suis]BDR27482.1 hypothetical protein HSHS1_02430 [Helicobacter suis HS1]